MNSIYKPEGEIYPLTTDLIENFKKKKKKEKEKNLCMTLNQILKN